MSEPANQYPVVTGQQEAPPALESPVEVTDEAASHTLQDMAKDFVFFTPALMVTHGLFDREPVVEFTLQHPVADPDLAPFAIDSEYPFFEGLPLSNYGGQTIDWNRRLYGIVKERWELIREFLSRIVLLDTRRKHYAKVCWHSLIVVDHLTLRTRPGIGELPTLTIFVFAVSGNKRFTYLAPAKDPPRTRPYPAVEAPRPDIIIEAEAVMGPPPDPEQLVQRLEMLRENETRTTTPERSQGN